MLSQNYSIKYCVFYELSTKLWTIQSRPLTFARHCISSKYVKSITEAITSCYTDVKLRAVLTSKGILPAARKDVLPIPMMSNVVYKFACHCDQWYIGKTTQRLHSRITEHVPRCIRTMLTNPNDQNTNEKLALARARAKDSSAIAEHLGNNEECLKNYSDDRFSILANGRNAYHLSVLESTYIMSYEPQLCKQKNFVYKLGLFWSAFIYLLTCACVNRTISWCVQVSFARVCNYH